MIINTERFADNLKMILKEKGLSQIEVSRQTGLHPMTICNWVTHGVLPTVDNLAILCTALNIPADDLIEGVVEW